MFVKKQKGLTLIEMMIALILALIVSAAILTIFISNIKSSAENIKMIQLNQELRAVMNFMSDELKRHGYSSNAASTAMNNLDYSTNGCVLYAYETASGAANTMRGFYFDGSQLKWAESGATACATVATTGEPLTSGETDITTFTVEPGNTASAANVTVHRLDVTIEGQRQLNPGVASRTFRETIRIRNEEGT